MHGNIEVLGNFTKEDILDNYNKLQENETLLVILTDYRELFVVEILKSDEINTGEYALMGGRPDAPETHKGFTQIIIKRGNVEYSFNTPQIVGVKIKKGD
jgi:hypothetical protein